MRKVGRDILNYIGKKSMNKKAVRRASEDAIFLLDKGYPKERVFELVGDRYRLKQKERWLLVRGVWSKEVCKSRKKKLTDLSKVKELGIDGYNVLITAESILGKDMVILCRDCLVRDVRGVFGKYKMSKRTEKTLKKIMERLKGKIVHWYFDSQVSKSGELAGMVRGMMNEFKIEGDVKTVKIVDRELKKFRAVATSDSVIIDKVKKVVDIPKLFLKKKDLFLRLTN